MRDLMVGGFPDLWAGGVVVAQRSVGVVVLVRAESAGNRVGKALGDLIVGARVVGARIGGGDDDFGAVCAQHGTLGFGDFVWQREDRTVAALLCDEREPDAGVAGGRFDYHTAGLELSGAFGGVDDALRDAVLGGSTGIEILHFDGDGRLDAVSDVMKLYEWRVADEFGKTVVNGHRGSCFLLRFDWCVIRFRIPGRWVERS